MQDQRTIGMNIGRPWREVYAAAWHPLTFARWASGMAEGNLREEGGVWHADGPGGPVTIRFTPHNDLGVMDHHVDTGASGMVYVPLRVVENGDGALVTLTIFRQAGMSDEKFAKDCAWVERDLEMLRRLVAP